MDPVQIPTPDSDESWTELYERTCGDPTPTAGDRGREKRPRSPEFIPEKRPKHDDALRVAFVNKKETIKAHCDFSLASLPGSPCVEGMEAAFTAWVAQICERPSGQELSVDEERRFAAEVDAAKTRELDAWGKFQVFSPVLSGKVTKDVVDTRWVLTWKDLEGKRTVKARLVARGFQDPDLVEGLVDASSCVSLRSSHLQVISLSALKKWKLWSLDIKNAFLQADPFPRGVYLHAPCEWCPRAHSRNDAPVEFRKTLQRYLVKSTESPKLVGLRFETSKLDPCLYTVFTGSDEAVGTVSTHIDDILGCGAPGVLDRSRQYLEHRFGALKVQERKFMHVGMELVQSPDFSVTLTQEEVPGNLPGSVETPSRSPPGG